MILVLRYKNVIYIALCNFRWEVIILEEFFTLIPESYCCTFVKMSICMGTSWKWGVCRVEWSKPIPWVNDASIGVVWHLNISYDANTRNRVSRDVNSETHQTGHMPDLLHFSKRRACQYLRMQQAGVFAGSSWKEQKKRELRAEGCQNRLQRVLLWLWPNANKKNCPGMSSNSRRQLLVSYLACLFE